MGTGNWCTYDRKKVSLINVLEAIKASGFKRSVVLTTDCCYSGHFPVLAKKFWNEKHPCVSQFQGISVSSSCDSETAIKWGAFRKYVEIQMKEGDDAGNKYFNEIHIPENGMA